MDEEEDVVMDEEGAVDDDAQHQVAKTFCW